MNIALSVNWSAFSVNWNALSVGYGHHGLELRALRFYGSAQEVKASRYGFLHLGRALGHFIFSLIGLKMILFTNIFQKLSKPHLVHA